MIISSIEQLMEAAPRIGEPDGRFSKTLERFFEEGNSFELFSAGGFKCYTSSEGNNYQHMIRANGQSRLLSPTNGKKSCWCSEQRLSFLGEYGRRIGDRESLITVNGVPSKQIIVEYHDIRYFSWPLLCRVVGILFKQQLANLESCSRCGGEGIIRQFMHIANGVCFKCFGIGKWYTPVKKSNKSKLTLSQQ